MPSRLFPSLMQIHIITYGSNLWAVLILHRRMHHIIDIMVRCSCTDIPTHMQGLLKPSMHLSCRDPCNFLLPPKPGPVDGVTRAKLCLDQGQHSSRNPPPLLNRLG